VLAAVTDGDGRDGDMPDDLLVNLCDQGQGKRPGCAQLTHDELLGVIGMRCVLEGLDRHLLDGLGIGGRVLLGYAWVGLGSKNLGKGQFGPSAYATAFFKRGTKKPPEGGSSSRA
jgi:hypothetical protein